MSTSFFLKIKLFLIKGWLLYNIVLLLPYHSFIFFAVKKKGFPLFLFAVKKKKGFPLFLFAI